MENLPTATHGTIQLYGQSLPPQERSKHRAWIGVRVEATLDGYWQNRPSDLVKAEILGDWMGALEAFTEDEIRSAFREYLSGPDCKRKPKPGDIRSIILSSRAQRVQRQPEPEPERKRVTTEAANEILAKAGLGPKRMGVGG